MLDACIDMDEQLPAAFFNITFCLDISLLPLTT
jgi:hypothetical protein